MLCAGTVPANNKYTTGTVSANKEYTAGTLTKLKFLKVSPSPSKYPLIHPKVAGLCPEVKGNHFPVISPL